MGLLAKVKSLLRPAPASARAFGDFELEALLGKGAMAEVYRARGARGRFAGQTVALKRVAPALAKDAAALELFRGEARLSMALDHPGIVKVFEVAKRGRDHYLVMEWVDGSDLTGVLRQCRQLKRPLPVSVAVWMARQLLLALAHAHALRGPDGKLLGVVHCDVGPSNVFVSREGALKLGDFGVARGTLKDPRSVLVAGKTHYLSPEVLEGQVTHEADLWAAAVTLYELLTLERPFQGASDAEVFQAIRMAEHVPLRERRPDAPEVLAGVLEHAFAHDRAHRFHSARDFEAALASCGLGGDDARPAMDAVMRALFPRRT